jgi:LPS-assembly protein
VPIFSTETGLVFERNTNLYGMGMVQTLEPKLYYVYIPAREQGQIPIFDTGLQDINLATLYSENQFSGNDRINDANQVTMGVTSRLLQQANGIERLRVGLAQRYYLKTQDVTLPGVAPRGSNSSDLLAGLSGTVARHWTVDAGWQYTTDFSQTQRLSAATRFQPEPGKLLNLSYRYVNGAVITNTGQTQTVVNAINPSNTLRQLDISGQWPLTGRLSAVARWNYSTADSRLLEGLAGLEYDGGCWAFRVVAHSYATTATTSVSSLYMQLELNGVSKIGSNPLELLRRNVAGYQRASPQPARLDDTFPGR